MHKNHTDFTKKVFHIILQLTSASKHFKERLSISYPFKNSLCSDFLAKTRISKLLNYNYLKKGCKAILLSFSVYVAEINVTKAEEEPIRAGHYSMIFFLLRVSHQEHRQLWHRNTWPFVFFSSSWTQNGVCISSSFVSSSRYSIMPTICFCSAKTQPAQKSSK